MAKEIKIYVANLGAYNDGKLKGIWFTLPVELSEVFKKVFEPHELDENGDPLGDYAIHDYEAPFSIKDYTSIQYLNEVAEMFEMLSEKDVELIVKMVELGYISDLLDGPESLQYVYRYENCKDMGDVAYQILHDSYAPEDYPLFFRHFDYDSYGEEIESSGTFIKLEDSIVEYAR